ncbi:uncharacterized mitochondrial protein-like protein [Tanacetum coccineum]
MVSRNNYSRVDYDYYAKTLHPSAHRNMVPRVILLKFGLTPLNTARPVYTPQPKPTVYSARSMSHFSKQAQSTDQRPFYKKTTLTNRYFHQKVNIVMRHYYTVRPRAVNTARPYTAPVNAVRAKRVIGKPQMDDKGFVDSGCSRHMTGNIAYLSDFKEFDGGYVTFRGGTHGGRISSGKGTLKTDCLDFEDVYFVNELKFNLFSVSQMCDKKNYVLFTNTECLVLSPNFKLTDESQILLKIPRKDNMYYFDMKNIVPKENLTCLVAKATLDESMLWHRRLGHINFKNINKLVKENLVRVAACTISNESASTQGDLNAGCGNDEPKSAADDIRQVKVGPHNESDDKDKSEDDSSPKGISYDLHSLKDMFKVGASHTLEATHVEFFSDEDEPEVNLGNIPNSYTVPTTPNTRIHKDYPIKNVIGDVKSTIEPTSIAKSLSDSSWVEAMQEVFRNKKDKKGIVIRNTARLVAQGHRTQVEGHRLRVFAPVARIEANEIVTQKEDGIFISQDKHVTEILKKFDYTDVKSASTPIDFEKPLVKDRDADDVNIHLYRSLIGSLMYLIASRQDIMFAVCTCARFQVTLKTSHLLAIKRNFRYLKGKPTLGLWYSRDSPFELVTYTDSDYAGATQDRKSTTRGCQFLGNRLISWQCKNQTVVATFTTKAEYVAAASCYGQVLWIQNQLLDYGYNFMNTVINIDNNNLLTKGFDAGSIVMRGVYLIIYRPQIMDGRMKYRDKWAVKEGLVIEAVPHKGLGARVRECERSATIASSLEAEQDSVVVLGAKIPYWEMWILKTRFKITSKQFNDLPLSRGYTLGSGGGQRDLHLDDAEGTDCLPTATIFEELARIGHGGGGGCGGWQLQGILNTGVLADEEGICGCYNVERKWGRVEKVQNCRVKAVTYWRVMSD